MSPQVMEESLTHFVREALSDGNSKEEIRTILLEANWPQDEINAALDSFADVTFPIPVPRPKPYLSAKEAFTYLVLFTLLYMSAWGLGALLFQLVERAFPDPAVSGGYRYFQRMLRWSIATLIISFPVFLFLSRKAYLAARRDPEKRKSKVRKWLTNVTLFLAAAILLGDLISLVFNLLEGEFTTRFLLKAAVVGGVAGSIFGYYLWDLRQDDLDPDEVPDKHPALRAFVGALTVVVVIAVIAGISAAGSPLRARGKKLDETRVRDLVSIANRLDAYWREHRELPTGLAELKDSRLYAPTSIRDPQTEAVYEYRVTGDGTYELCADFEQSTEPNQPRSVSPQPSRFWEHEAGWNCFQAEIRSRD